MLLPSSGVDRRLVIVTRSFISLASCYARTNGALGLRLIIPHRVCLAKDVRIAAAPKIVPPTVMVAAAPPRRTHRFVRRPTRASEKGHGERDLRDVRMRAGLERWDPGGRRNTFCKEGS